MSMEDVRGLEQELERLRAENRELRNRLALSPAMDDKVGVWTVMETLRLLRGRPLQAAVYCGVPAANAAFHAAKEVLGQENDGPL